MELLMYSCQTVDYASIKGYGRPDWSIVLEEPVPVDKPAQETKPAEPAETEREDREMKYYEKLGDVPESYRPTIYKLMESGDLKGRSDPDPDSLEDNVLDVSEDFCRIMTTLDRRGCWIK